MEVQPESGEPPADPQPAGKINKAAFKLFGKRRPGSGVASFFFRNKGALSNGNPSSENGHGSTAAAAAAATAGAAEPVAPVELVRSKTHDGLPTGPEGQGRGEALGGGGGAGGGGGGSLEAVPVRSLSKSFSFFSFLRRSSTLRTGEGGGAGLARRGRGLKGLFSSMRWRRGRDRASEADDGDAARADEAREAEGGGRAERGADITLTLEPLPHLPAGDTSHAEPGPMPIQNSPCALSQRYAATNPDSNPVFPCTPMDSPLHRLLSPERRRPDGDGADGADGDGSDSARSPATAAAALLGRCGAADPPSEPSVDRLCSLLFTDVTSLKSFDSLTGCGDIIADTEEEGLGGANGGSGTSSSSSGGGGANGASTEEARGRRTARTSQGSPARHPLPSSQLTRSAFSSVSSAPPTPPPSLPARAQLSPPQPEHVVGSGVVAYMGGGEEMASPEGVDDADMQGLWHMLPSTGDNSPALPRPHQGPAAAPAAATASARDRKPPQVKALGLSKIPVVGAAGGRAAVKPQAHHHAYAARQPASPGDKEPLSDEGYWDTPSATPSATPVDEGVQRSERIILSRDSCSGDHLYDLYNDPEEDKEEDLSSSPSPSSEYKLSPASQATPPSSSSSPPSFRCLRGSASLPRDSKIPLSVRQSPPPHSVSQSSLPSVLEASAPQPKSQAPAPARTRIPVSKVPVRRSGQNKPGNASRGPAHRK